MAILRLMLRHASGWVILGAVALSETLLCDWALRLAGRPGLGWGAGPVLGAALLAWNLLVVVVTRRLARGPAPLFALSRVLMLGSLGALLAAPGMVLASVASALAPGDGVLLAGGGAAAALGFGTILWGWLVGQRRLRVEHVDLPVRDLPRALEGLRVAHISDLHIGRQLRGPRLEGLLERVNALEPDLIVITGDLFDFDPAYVDEGCAALARLRARHGVYAVLGNHDVYTGADTVAAGLARNGGVRLLRDELARLRIDGAELWLVGVEDPGHGWALRDAESEALERLAAELPRGAAAIALLHRPSWFRHAARLGLSTALAGHTHGGQIALPPPAHHHNVGRLVAHWTRGLFEIDGAYLYVSRGLGVAGPPVRLNCAREIGLLRLVPAPPATGVPLSAAPPPR